MLHCFQRSPTETLRLGMAKVPAVLVQAAEIKAGAAEKME